MALLGQLSCGSAAGRSLKRCAQGWCLLLSVLAFLTGTGQVAAQAVSREYQLKAVLLYNLTQFVEWPKSAFESDDAPLVIGVLGDNPFGSLLEEAVRNERSNNHRIVVKRFSTAEQAKECAMVFVSASRQKEFAAIVAQLIGRPVLTVSDADGFLQGGGMIRFAQNAENKIRVKVNLEVVKARGLTISAKLLRVAEIVGPQGD